MAYIFFQILRKFSHCPPCWRVVEYWVVSKPVFTFGGECYYAFANAFKLQASTRGVMNNYYTSKSGCALFPGDIPDLFQQIGYPFTIGKPFAAVARRLNTRRAGESVHLQARVVGQSQQSAGIGVG